MITMRNRSTSLSLLALSLALTTACGAEATTSTETSRAAEDGAAGTAPSADEVAAAVRASSAWIFAGAPTASPRCAAPIAASKSSASIAAYATR